MVSEEKERLIVKGGVNEYSIRPDLNFRLRLDIGGANIRIADKIKENEEGIWYVDPESGLDIDFDITKTWSPTPNESKITVWNLNNETYNKIQNEATGFELYAAFSDNEYALMFRGYPQKALKKSKETILTANKGFLAQSADAGRAGQNDIETVFTLIDGKIELQEATINKEYKNTVSTYTILMDCVETFGTPIGSMAAINHKELRNFTARGKTKNIINYLAQLLGFKWNITNGIFNLYTGEIPKQPYGILLNGANSATPERQDDKFKTHSKNITVEKTEQGFMIETMLLPFLNPGIFCSCDFPILQGTKFIYKVNHLGNNYGTQAITRIFVV